MSTPSRFLIATVIIGSIALANAPVHAGLATSPIGVRGPVCRGLATSPLGVTGPVARGLATSPLGVQSPVRGGPSHPGPVQAPRDQEPETFEEFLELMFGNGGW